MRIRVRIVTLVFAIAMLASVPSAMAGEYATTSMGTVQFENGTLGYNRHNYWSRGDEIRT